MYTILLVDDDQFPHYVSRAVPLLNADGGVREWVGTPTDVHERKGAEELERTKLMLELLLTSAPVGVCCLNRDRRYLVANNKLAKMNSMLAAQRGKTAGEIVPVLLAPARDVTGTILVTGHAILNHLFSRETPLKSGLIGCWRESWFPVRDEAAVFASIGVVASGSPESRRAEEALRHENAELSRANADLTEFAFAASHDLQEPLRMIACNAELLVKSLGGALNGESAAYADSIVVGIKRMQELISDLLAYTQIISNHQEELELVELDQVVQQTFETLSTSIEASGALIRSDHLPTVSGHRAHFRQLFQNLIGNAVKYRSGERAPEVFVWSARDGADWRLCVTDNGVGIAPEYHDQIFGVFKRLHGNEIPGTGLGLAICKRVVERYGGRIWVESEANKGAAFYFTVPVALARAAAGA
jgi:signal transduction histidine kinase